MKMITGLVGALAVVAAAPSWHAGSTLHGQTHEAAASRRSGDVVVAGRIVRVEAPVDGDVAVAGSNVTIAAPVQGYVMAAGSDVRIEQMVADDVWAAGQTVTVSGAVQDNLRAAGRRVVLESSGSTGGNARLVGNSVDVRGRIGRDLNVAATTLTIGSEVAGSVDANAGKVEVLPGAVVHGDLRVSGPTPPAIAPGAQILGQVVHRPAESDRNAAASWLMRWGYMFLALFVLGAAVLAVSRAWMTRVAERLATRLGWSFLAGVITLVVTPLLVILLAVTVIGIPLAVVVLALYAATIALSGAFVSYRVGTWLLTRLDGSEGTYARLAAGVLLVTFLAALPWIGFVVQAFVVLSGIGALMLERQDARRMVPA